MGIDSFDRANSSLDFNRDDVKGVAGLLKDKEVLFDVFSILITIGIILWIVLLVMSLMSQMVTELFVPIVGSISVILIIIFTARRVYADIESDINKKCEGSGSAVSDDYLIESTNRFYSILSFLYFYIKTYVMTVINICIFCLCLFIFHHSLYTNINKERDDSWAIMLKNKLTNEQEGALKVLGYIYYSLGFIVYVYIYFAVFLYLSSNFLFDYPIFKRISWMANTNLTAGFLMLVFIPVVLYFNDQLTHAWRTLIENTAHTIKNEGDEYKIYPVLEIFTQGKVFEYLNLTIKENAIRNIRIFLYGLVMSMIFAFVVLPTFDVERLCSLNTLKLQSALSDVQKSEHTDLTIRSKEFHSRFKFGYFMMIIVTVFLHICDLSMRSLLVAIDSKDYAVDEEVLLARESIQDYNRQANEDKREFRAHDISLIQALNEIVNGEIRNQSNETKRRVSRAHKYLRQQVQEKIQSYKKKESELLKMFENEEIIRLALDRFMLWKSAQESIKKIELENKEKKEEEKKKEKEEGKIETDKSFYFRTWAEYGNKVAQLLNDDKTLEGKLRKRIQEKFGETTTFDDLFWKGRIDEKADELKLQAAFVKSEIAPNFKDNFVNLKNKYEKDVEIYGEKIEDPDENSNKQADMERRKKAIEMVQYFTAMIPIFESIPSVPLSGSTHPSNSEEVDRTHGVDRIQRLFDVLNGEEESEEENKNDEQGEGKEGI